MKTCIKMSNGNVYVIDEPILTIYTWLADTDEDFIKIEGTDGRGDFYINSLQVCAIYPARPE